MAKKKEKKAKPAPDNTTILIKTLADSIVAVNKRIDRIVAAIGKSKSVRGL